MTLVVDASVVVAALVDGTALGAWSEERLRTDALVAPHLLPAEVTNVLRRAVVAGELGEDSAALAHRDLLDLRIGLFPYEATACGCGSSVTT